ncbi:phosphomannomutase [Acetobacter tropicalis]|uniref:Phosphomannomutase n=2 Tax=Acetobacter tropicalis TaxID=104102 RepID=A0A094YM71_9PROT|nr:phosphomannomutase [Acetobacter tropicalis]KAA8388698.1 phosphomannomutase [Acetobacter tropicalis]KGB23150.1 Phosphomannomutase [Acetobacter tropicalis]
MKISQWMEQSGVNFGTSGARGLVSKMTDMVCFAYTMGYLQHLSTLGEFSPQTMVAVAGDLRSSTPRIMGACIAAIEYMGGRPLFCGFVPSPALCHYAFALKIPSLMVTGSHIPADRNGIKFNRAQGEFLKNDEEAMRAQDIELPKEMFDTEGMLIKSVAFPPITDVLPDFIARYRDFFGPDALRGFYLGIYQHSAVGRDVLVDIVESLGAEAIPLARSKSFVAVDTEAVRPEDIALARKWAEPRKFDAILTTDGDSDRPLLADKDGHWLRGDVLGILASRFLKAASVTTPVSSNTALEKAGFAQHMQRTRIGSPFVISEMMKAIEAGVTPAVGYEANGGFLLGSDVTYEERTLSALPTRDSVLPMICALVAAKLEKKGLSSLVNDLPRRFTQSDRLTEMPTEKSLYHIDLLRKNPNENVENLGFSEICGFLSHVDETDGLRMTFQNDDIVHLRPSGNAPELRIYVETDSPDRTETLLQQGLNILAKWKEPLPENQLQNFHK